MVRVEIGQAVYSGIGTSPDVIEASARAYLNAFNRYFMNGIGLTSPPRTT
ncbi:MAG: alpha-isopropylmalate synthase regulatory domain-containing protein [Syntrophobacteraceae bacterium]